MALTEKQKKHLRRLAHPMNPIVMLGNADHELVKVSARIGERDARNDALAMLASRTLSELVQRVGHVGVYYRRRNELPKILIPD